MEWTLYVYSEAGASDSSLAGLEVISSIELAGDDAKIFMSRLALYMRIKKLIGDYANYHLLPMVKDDKLSVRLVVSDDEVIEVVVNPHEVKNDVRKPHFSEEYVLRYSGEFVPSYDVLFRELNARYTGFELDAATIDTDEVKAYVNTYVNEFIADYME